MQNENEIEQLKTHTINFVKGDFESELQALHMHVWWWKSW